MLEWAFLKCLRRPCICNRGFLYKAVQNDWESERERVRKESGKYKKMMRTPSSSTQPRALRVTRDGMSLFGVELSLSFRYIIYIYIFDIDQINFQQFSTSSRLSRHSDKRSFERQCIRRISRGEPLLHSIKYSLVIKLIAIIIVPNKK